MSRLTIRPTATKPYSLPNEPMSALATQADVVNGTTPLIIPTADPKISGSLWNDGGTLTISAG